MAQNITVAGASYTDVPSVELPKTGGGTASFTDVSDTTAEASDVVTGKTFYTAGGVRSTGSGPSPDVYATNSMLATVETTTTASKEYAIGDLLVYDGRLYKVTSAITLGSTLIPNGNIEQTTVEQELSVANNDVTDVQVNGASVVNNGVANIPVASETNLGLVKAKVYMPNVPIDGGGVQLLNDTLYVIGANASRVKAGNDLAAPITVGNQYLATFYGLAKAAGADEKNSSLSPGQYTENAKSAIHEMLNAPVTVSGTTPTIAAKSGISYKCGEVSTLTITLPASGIVDVVFTSGTTPTVFTVTPPTGVTLKWANGFDPDNLDADTTYEINIADGLGVAASWT